jgi:hypothetical protein
MSNFVTSNGFKHKIIVKIIRKIKTLIRINLEGVFTHEAIDESNS